MKRAPFALFLLIMMTLAFLAGRHFVGSKAEVQPSGRKVLYYVDPMHPSYKSDKPGTAPDCGMDLEPVYADGGAPTANAQMPAGTVNLSYDQQQMIGVRVAPVEHSQGAENMRLVARVAPDEQRVYRLTAAVDGWIEKLQPNSSGTLVRKNELLATYYAPEVVNATQSYVGYLEGSAARAASDIPSQRQISVVNRLLNLGMSEMQIQELATKRESQAFIKIVAPTDGLILSRTAAPGQRFDKGAEMYRIADLSHVWIVADIFENEEKYFRPGTTAIVSLPGQGHKFKARVSNTIPTFDPNTRTLKLRLDADNPGLVLRPDMFVDVELPVRVPSGLSVPSDAILDSGLKKRVFVDLGQGLFEPREVETGSRFGNRLQILKGVNAGERVVVAGTFLLDSESRLQTAAAAAQQQPAPGKVKDPSCGMDVDPAKAEAAGRVITFEGAKYYFCSDGCKTKFAQSHETKAQSKRPAATAASMPMANGGHQHKPKHTSDGVTAANAKVKDVTCGMEVDPAEAEAAGRVITYQGTKYYFCSDGCKANFTKSPEKYIAGNQAGHHHD